MNISKLLILALLLSVQYCSARIVFGIRDDSTNTLIKFDSSNPSQVLSSFTIAGLNTGEVVVGIDIRPSNGKVYIVTTSSVVRVLNTLNGAASAGVSMNACTTPGTSGVRYAIDFNPQVDLLRIISTSGLNYAVNVDTGACTIATAISGSPTPTLAAIAYSNNVRNATSTTLFAINSVASNFGSIAAPGGGVFAAIGNLGITTSASVGFDIVAGNSWATLTPTGASSSSLYVIDVTTGVATVVGTPIAGSPLKAIALSLNEIQRSFYGHNDAGQLFRLESEDFSSWIPYTITGLLTNEFLLGVDFRLSDGGLYAVSNNSNIYIINPFTAAATKVGNTLNCTITGNYFGVDWNPTVDLLRVITDSGANYRINVGTSACFVDSLITSTTATNPLLSSVAYTNNFAGASGTTLYAIDYQGDTFGTVTPPNDGVYVFVANLPIATGPATAFDIFGTANVGVAALSIGNIPYFVNIDLGTAALNFLGSPSNVNVRSLSASYVRFPYPLNQFNPEIFVLTATQNLVRYNSNNTVSALSTVAITGLTAGTTLLGMDLRPSSNELVGVSSDNKVYVIYPPTGVAYLLSTMNCSLNSASSYSFDFNPTVDLIRIVSRTGENYRVNPTTGVCFVDGTLTYTGGGVVPATGVAYTNSFSGATSTSEFVLTTGSSQNFAQVTNPNGGTTAVIGDTGLTITSQTPFDILTNGQQQQGFALVNGVLYDVNLGSGATRTYGPIGLTNHIGLAVLPLGYTPPPAPGTPTTTPTSTPTVTPTTSNATSTSTSTSTTSSTSTTGSGASSVAVSILLLVASLVIFM